LKAEAEQTSLTTSLALGYAITKTTFAAQQLQEITSQPLQGQQQYNRSAEGIHWDHTSDTQYHCVGCVVRQVGSPDNACSTAGVVTHGPHAPLVLADPRTPPHHHHIHAQTGDAVSMQDLPSGLFFSKCMKGLIPDGCGPPL
jgi:hypothetical protein